MDQHDGQFLEAQLEHGDFFLPETTFDLSLYGHHLAEDAAQLETLGDEEAEDWFVGESASAISEIRRQSALYQELVAILEAQLNAESESKGDLAVKVDQQYDGDQAALGDARDNMYDAARTVAFAHILMARRLSDDMRMRDLHARVAELLDAANDSSDLEGSFEFEEPEVSAQNDSLNDDP